MVKSSQNPLYDSNICIVMQYHFEFFSDTFYFFVKIISLTFCPPGLEWTSELHWSRISGYGIQDF